MVIFLVPNSGTNTRICPSFSPLFEVFDHVLTQSSRWLDLRLIDDFCCRFQRPRSDCLPHPNIITGGSNVSGSRKSPATPASRSSKDDAAPTVATDSSCLAAFLASTSLEPKPRAHTPKPLAQGGAFLVPHRRRDPEMKNRGGEGKKGWKKGMTCGAVCQ